MNDQDKLMDDAARLAKEIRPERDLWPGIEAEITGSAKRRWSPVYAQAAAVVLLVVASSGITYFAVKGDGAAPLAVQPNYVFDEAAFGESYSLGPGFTDARSGLASKLDTQLAKLAPEERANIEENLAMIRGAIDEINAELSSDPDNAQLQSLLLKAYREELMLMRQIGNLTQSVTSRNDI